MPAKAITPTEVEALLERIERAALRAPVPIYQRFGGRAPATGGTAGREGRTRLALLVARAPAVSVHLVVRRRTN